VLTSSPEVATGKIMSESLSSGPKKDVAPPRSRA
jgi:hypothetical protein